MAAEACTDKLTLNRAKTIIGHGTPDDGFAIEGRIELSVMEVRAICYEIYG